MAYLDLTDANEYPLTVGEDLVPPRSDGPKPTLSLDFSSLLNPPLVLKQDLTEGCGGQTWPAGMVLAKYLLRCKIDDFKNKTMFVCSVFHYTSTERTPRKEILGY